jgi:beta-glucosidase
MKGNDKTQLVLCLAVAVLVLFTGPASSQPAARVAQIPGIAAGPCDPGTLEKPWMNKEQTPECRALEAIAQMTPEEKQRELGGITGRGTNQRLGLIAGGGSDGPNGIATMRGNPQPRGRDVTAFPNAVTLAATWSRNLAAQYGKALGEEFVGKGSNSILGPTINIMRTWHWGRNGETFSEDPYLTAELVVPEIKALQEQKVLTVLKHYVGNNQENTRVGVKPDNAGIDARIPDKALHEIYLPAFKAAVQKAHTGAIMCSYNQVNGKFSCNNSELLGLLRQWGFDGFIAPDAVFALRDPLTAALAGVTRGVTGAPTLVAEHKLSQGALDRMVYYNILPYFRLGIYDSPSKGKPDANVSTREHQALARQIAEQGAVLLKNRREALPIDIAKVKTIAVIGDDAGPHATTGINGSAHVYATKVSVPLEAIRARAGAEVKVIYEPGTSGIGPMPDIPANALKPSSGNGSGLLASYYTSSSSTGIPVVKRVEPGVKVTTPPPEVDGPSTSLPSAGRGGGRGPGGPQHYWSARWTGTLDPPVSGAYKFSLTGVGTAQLYVDHVAVAAMMRADFAETVQGMINLKSGRPVPIEVKYSNASAVLGSGVQLGWQPPEPGMLARAVAAAKQADVAIVFAAEQMGEGQDKVTLPLPGDQNILIDAVASANPRTVVVLHTSNPVSMPWLDKTAAVVEAFYPGQEAGSSIARLLFGDVNFSGKLAMTFPANPYQGPGSTFLEYPGDGMTVNYDEGVFVGYRFYDAKGQTPLFPFGFGLSYTSFRYSDLKVDHTSDEQAAVSFSVTNTGSREGAEVAQLYLGFPAAAEEPPKELRGFEKLTLKPGETKVVSMHLDRDSLAAWVQTVGDWRVFPGAYSVMVGSSSRNIALRGGFTIRPR